MRPGCCCWLLSDIVICVDVIGLAVKYFFVIAFAVIYMREGKECGGQLY